MVVDYQGVFLEKWKEYVVWCLLVARVIFWKRKWEMEFDGKTLFKWDRGEGENKYKYIYIYIFDPWIGGCTQWDHV